MVGDCFLACCFILILNSQRYNADYELSAKQGADTLAYIALLEEKLLPALVNTSEFFIMARIL